MAGARGPKPLLPNRDRCGFDAAAQIKATREAKEAARMTWYHDRTVDLAMETIREMAKRGVNMELGHEKSRRHEDRGQLLRESIAG